MKDLIFELRSSLNFFNFFFFFFQALVSQLLLNYVYNCRAIINQVIKILNSIIT